ncbi:MAG: S-methyl-5'-thioadenosine phosphorylase [Candidatus Methanomethylicia archaeon]
MKGNLRIGIIGGSGMEKAIEGEKYIIETPYGDVFTKIGFISNEKVIFIPRHGEKHEKPPHKVNYRGNIWALKSMGVERIIATNAVGGIRDGLKPGDLLLPHDFIDFTKSRFTTFYDDETIHIDMSKPYCQELREIIFEKGKSKQIKIWKDGVYACMEGPRFETPSEIRMLRILGADVVGMTGIPEVNLAREMKMCYATICIITNYAAGMQERISHEEVNEIMKNRIKIIMEIINEVIPEIPLKRERCDCEK